MSLVPTWPIAVGTLVIGVLSGAYVDHAVMESRAEKVAAAHAEELRQREVQRAADEATVRKNEQQMTEAIGLAEQEKSDEIAKVRNTAAAQLASLQNRPNRKPASASGVPQATAACEGATGAELSRPDAEFSLRLAERADEQRAALAACYKAYDSVR